MAERKKELGMEQVGRFIERHWVWLTLAAWAIYCVWFVTVRWGGIQGFALGDTDDNLRMSQVRALLAGQDWFDLRQYKMSPPAGANVHWSRLVDLPLAAIILLLRPLLGGAEAERIAVAAAPMVPLIPLLFGVALTVRRLVDRRAILLAFGVLFFAGSTQAMFMPLRIDHHGWQLALLSLGVAAMADPKRARGGALLGLITALSLSIGLELLIYLALAGTATVLTWIDDRDQRRRLAAYAATLVGGTTLGFLAFASYANRQQVCDALSPVWLSDALLGGALLLGLAMLSPADWKRRLALAAAAGAAVALFHALAWPHCLSRLEGVSPEVHELWLSHVREARPVYRHGLPIAALIVALPITGLFGWALIAWRARADRERLRRVLSAAAPAFAATVLLLWQTRTGPAAQMLGVAGAVALVWVLVPLTLASRFAVVRVVGPVIAVVAGMGAIVPLVVDALPGKKRTTREIAIAKANRECNSLWAMRPIAQQPKGLVFTFVDLGPRLITVTHHNAVIGPYHRNGEAIGDVMKTFRGTADNARATLDKYRADYLMICPNSSTTTIFLAEARGGFYGQLSRGQIPVWLDPVELPEKSPFKLWRVQR